MEKTKTNTDVVAYVITKDGLRMTYKEYREMIEAERD